MLEADLQAAVIEVARTFGWQVAHFRAARTKHGWTTPVAADGAGFPDLVLIHPDHGLLWRELKSAQGRLSPDQIRWGELLTATGADWAVWRPADMPVIVAQLSGGAAQLN